jgi:hypothetical protein
MIKGKEEVLINVITDVDVSDVNFIAQNNFNLGWKNQNYAPNFLSHHILAIKEHRTITKERAALIINT